MKHEYFMIKRGTVKKLQPLKIFSKTIKTIMPNKFIKPIAITKDLCYNSMCIISSIMVMIFYNLTGKENIMKMKKLLRLCALLLVPAVCLSMAAIAVAADTTEFTDVEAGSWYEPAVQWGIEAGITNGVGENRFDPRGEVTRAQVVTFLWRMVGEPTPAVTETFTDVEAGSWYEPAVQWAEL